MRPGIHSRDERGLLLATVWSLSGTCARRRVGCVLTDAEGQQISSGYNGTASGEPHCRSRGGPCEEMRRCRGADLKSGEGLDVCEAIHAEQNALMRCKDISRIHTCYTTTAPCMHCVKMLMGTSCQRIVFQEDYPHSKEARRLWERPRIYKGLDMGASREWIQFSPEWTVTWLSPR